MFCRFYAIPISSGLSRFMEHLSDVVLVVTVITAITVLWVAGILWQMSMRLQQMIMDFLSAERSDHLVKIERKGYDPIY